MKNTELLILPNGIPTYKLMVHVPTENKCQFISINKPIFEEDINNPGNNIMTQPLTITIKVFRKVEGIDANYKIEVNPDDLKTWNESMEHRPSITYRTRKGKTRTVDYSI
jgi:hypothetical protein